MKYNEIASEAIKKEGGGVNQEIGPNQTFSANIIYSIYLCKKDPSPPCPVVRTSYHTLY